MSNKDWHDNTILSMFKYCDVSINKVNNTYVINNLLQTKDVLYCFFNENGLNFYGITINGVLIKFSSRTVNVMIKDHTDAIVNAFIKRLGVVGRVTNINQ